MEAERGEHLGVTPSRAGLPWKSQGVQVAARGTRPAQVGWGQAWPRRETEARRGRCGKAPHVGWEGRVLAHTDQVSVLRGVPWQLAAGTQCHLGQPGVAHLAAICHARRAQVSRRSCVTSASPAEMSQVPRSLLNCTRHLCRGPGFQPSPAQPAFSTVIILHSHSDERGPVSCTCPQALHYNRPT